MIYGAISLGHCLSSSLPSVSLRLRPTASKKGPQCKCDSFTSRPFVNRRFCGLSPALLVCFDSGNCECDYCVCVCVTLRYGVGGRRRKAVVKGGKGKCYRRAHAMASTTDFFCFSKSYYYTFVRVWLKLWLFVTLDQTITTLYWRQKLLHQSKSQQPELGHQFFFFSKNSLLLLLCRVN